MYGEIITIGNELISGRTLDLNAGYAAGRLTAAGLRVTRITSVGDDHEMVAQTLAKALESSRFVIVTGGLGPTDDDMTNEIIAAALNRSLRLDHTMLEKIKTYLEMQGRKMTASIEKMAWLPQGSRILNPDGAVCGCCIIEQGVRLYFLPGVPEEMRYLLDKFVLPEILKSFEDIPFSGQRILKIYGISEADISEILKKLRGKMEGVVLGFYPRFPENHITLSLSGRDRAAVTGRLDQAEKEIRSLLGSFVFAAGDLNMEEVVGRKLIERGETISVAESCSGGLIGHRLTNVPGSSLYFHGGVIVYSNQSKIELLRVNPTTLETFGAVSDQTVREMVRGLRKRFHTNLGIAVTGIAGPDGGTREKPVGTVYIGLAAESGIVSAGYRFIGDRKQIKMETAMMAMDWIRRYLDGNSFLPGI